MGDKIKIEALQPCNICSGSIFPIFYRFKIEMSIIDTQNIQKQNAMTDYLGGNINLAKVFWTDDTGAEILSIKEDIIICQNCFLSRLDFSNIFDLDKILEKKTGEKEI